MAEKLQWLDEKYLSHYDYLEIDSEVQTQAPFEKMREIVKDYSISAEESEEDNTYLSYNKSVGRHPGREALSGHAGAGICAAVRYGRAFEAGASGRRHRSRHYELL